MLMTSDNGLRRNLQCTDQRYSPWIAVLLISINVISLRTTSVVYRLYNQLKGLIQGPCSAAAQDTLDCRQETAAVRV